MMLTAKGLHAVPEFDVNACRVLQQPAGDQPGVPDQRVAWA
jgi:hypothetical protein